MEDKKKVKVPVKMIQKSRQLLRANMGTLSSSPEIPSLLPYTSDNAHHENLEKSASSDADLRIFGCIVQQGSG